MSIDEAITDLTERVKGACPEAVIRVKKRSAEEATMRVYAPADREEAIKAATQDITLSLGFELGWASTSSPGALR